MLRAALENYRGDDAVIDQLFQDCGVPRHLLEQDNARLSAEKYSALLQGIMVAMGDEMLGYGRQPHPLGMWKLMSQAVITADSLGEALKRYCRFFSLFDWGIRLRLDSDENGASLTLLDTDPSQPLSAYPYVSTLFYGHRLASWLIDREIPISSVELACKPPFYVSELRPMYRYAPLHFGATGNRLHFTAELLSQPLKQDQQSLQEFVANPNLVMISREFEQSSWQARVQKIIDRDLSQIPGFEAIAKQLDIHPQTLRRRLHSEGLEFRELKNLARRDAAIDLLLRTGLSIEAIAAQLGFNESSNFIRAFRQWTGVTPYSYRKGH